MDEEVEPGLPPESGPERTCIVTRQKGAPDTMLRFVVGPDGAVVFDVRRRLPGRGAWLVNQAEVLGAALKRKAFARAFKREVRVEPDLVERTRDGLAADALQSLALANKAGQLVCGSTKVSGALEGGQVAALIHATEAATDGSRKVEAAARRAMAGTAASLPVVELFESPQMDLALGRVNVIHAALLIGGASDAFLKRAARLAAFSRSDLRAVSGSGPIPLAAETGADAEARWTTADG